MSQRVTDRLQVTYQQMGFEIDALPLPLFIVSVVLTTIGTYLIFEMVYGSLVLTGLIIGSETVALWISTVLVEINQQKLSLTTTEEWGRLLATIALVVFVTGIGILLFVVPGIYLLIRTGYAIPIATREDNRPVENLRQSFARTKVDTVEIGTLTAYTGVVLLLVVGAVNLLQQFSFVLPNSTLLMALVFSTALAFVAVIYQRTLFTLSRGR